MGVRQDSLVQIDNVGAGNIPPNTHMHDPYIYINHAIFIWY
jgi:hypothetical protein